VTYDGSTASLYLDNSLIGSVYAPGFNGTGSMTGAIGNDSYLIGSPFQGNIDEFRISDVALTPDQFLNVVPEPSSGLLLVLGLFGFLWVRHRGDPRPAR
jgi:hypothetical protein